MEFERTLSNQKKTDSPSKKTDSRTLTGHERSFPKSYGHDIKSYIKSIQSRIQFSIDMYRQNRVFYGQMMIYIEKHKKEKKMRKIVDRA